MGVQLFQRDWRVVVGTLGISAPIDIEFEVKKTLKPEPNTCSLKIFNLDRTHRRAMEQNYSLPTSKVPVAISAGYQNGPLHQIFLGELRAGMTTTDGADQVTELSTGDGEKAIATARLNVSMGAGTPISVVLAEMAAALGVKPGNVQQAVSLLEAKGVFQFSIKAQYLKGNSAQHITDLAKSAGMEWSVQDGALQFLNLGQPLVGQALLLNADTGLLGSPSVDSKGLLHGKTLLIPGLSPGVLVMMDSLTVKGGYRVETVEYKGASLGDEWGAEFQASKF